MDRDLTGRESFYLRARPIDLGIFVLTILLIFLRFVKIFFPACAPILIAVCGAGALFTFLYAFSEAIVYRSSSQAWVILANIACAVSYYAILFSFLFWPGGFLLASIAAALTFCFLFFMAISAGDPIFPLRPFYNLVLVVKVTLFGGLAMWILLNSPQELFRTIHYKGEDPQAYRLFKAHIDDPSNKDKKDTYLEYMKR